MKINIAFAINKPYLFFCMITILSILRNSSKNEFLSINIVHDGSITHNNINYYLNNVSIFKKYSNYSINIIDISTHMHFNKINFRYKNWGKEVFYKVLFPSLFPNLNKILYLDVDLIVKGSLGKIFSINMGDYLFLGCSIGKYRIHNNYSNGSINGGVLLLNIKQLRSENIEREWLNYILKHNIHEEDAINKFFYNRIIYTDKFYCISKRQPKLLINKEINKAIIIHYVARKPWVSKPFCIFINKSYTLWYDNLKYFIPKNKKTYKFILLKFYLLHIHRYLFSITKRLKNYHLLLDVVHNKVHNYGKNQIKSFIKDSVS